MDGTFQTKKSLGQHFLTSPLVPNWLCDAADLTPGETVLEVGPGTGVLTAELLGRGVKVIALEADPRAIGVLTERFPTELRDGRLHLEQFDVRSLNLETKTEVNDQHYKVVSNIPYYLSGHLFRTFLATTVQPSQLVFLVQKEVAKRATVSQRSGEKESLLSLSIQAYGTPRYVKTVARGHFNPPPQVDSAIIAITKINREHFKNLDETFFFQLLRQGFGQKRKQLLGNLSELYDRSRLINSFSTVGLASSVRAEDVPLEQWLQLAKHLAER